MIPELHEWMGILLVSFKLIIWISLHLENHQAPLDAIKKSFFQILGACQRELEGTLLSRCKLL